MMRPSRRRWIRCGIAASVLVLSGCRVMEDLAKFDTALEAKYHTAATVNLRDDSHLTILFQDAPALEHLKGDSANLGAFARDVAIFAKHTYRDAAELEDVTVGFQDVHSLGPLTMTNTDAPFTFQVSDLP